MHEFLGGIRIGDSSCNAINYSYPFTKVVFTENALQLSIGVFFLKKRYFLPYYAITGVSLKKGIVCRGILIKHQLNHIPEFIVFWTGRYKRFLEECKKYSIPIN